MPRSYAISAARLSQKFRAERVAALQTPTAPQNNPLAIPWAELYGVPSEPQRALPLDYTDSLAYLKCVK